MRWAAVVRDHPVEHNRDNLPAHTEPVDKPVAGLRLSPFLEERVPVAVVSAWSSQSTTNETASLNSWCGPALIAWKRRPKSVKSTTFTEPAARSATRSEAA